jgi:hypothetical protein
MNGLDM